MASKLNVSRLCQVGKCFFQFKGTPHPPGFRPHAPARECRALGASGRGLKAHAATPHTQHSLKLFYLQNLADAIGNYLRYKADLLPTVSYSGNPAGNFASPDVVYDCSHILRHGFEPRLLLEGKAHVSIAGGAAFRDRPP